MLRKITVNDIAREVGVSQPVVSTVLGGGNSTTKVGEATRRRVREAAERLGYKKDILAHAFQKQQSFLIGILFSGVNYVQAVDFTFGTQSVIAEHGYAPVFFTHGSTEQERVFLEQCLDRRVEGLIVNCAVDADGGTNVERFEELREDGVPIVEVFGRCIPKVPAVNLDNREAGRRAVELLLAAGHREIVHFTHEHYRERDSSAIGLFWNAWEYWQGYEEAMSGAGLDPCVVTHPLSRDLLHPGARYRGACAMAQAIFTHDSTPSAVVCFSNEEAEAVLRAVDLHRIPVSDDFHVVSFGGYDSFTGSDKRRTTLHEPVTGVGREAAVRIFTMIEGGEADGLALGPDETMQRFDR